MARTTARCKRPILGGKIHALEVGREITFCGQRCPEFRIKPDDTQVTCDRCASKLKMLS